MKAKKTLGAVATSVGFVVGFAALTSAAPGSSIGNTGPDSYNKIKNTASQYLKVRNYNTLKLDNDNHQKAWTGDAKVNHNTTGGDATSGDAKNANSLNVSATVNNAASSAALAGAAGGFGDAAPVASIDTTGPDSYNKIENKVTSHVDVKNSNYIKVDNDNYQTASSGDARVSDNTTGGDATSGDASNTNSTSVTFHVSN